MKQKTPKTLLLACAIAMTISGDSYSNNALTCKTVSEYAETVMKARQGSVSIRKIIKGLEKVQNPATKKAMSGIITAAYKKPLYSTPTIQQKTIVEFGNEIYLACENTK